MHDITGQDALGMGIVQVSKSLWLKANEVSEVHEQTLGSTPPSVKIVMRNKREHVVPGTLRDIMAILAGEESWQAQQRVPA